jgi:hypothetical protein
MRLIMVVHVYSASFLGGGSTRISVRPRKNQETLFEKQTKKQKVWGMAHVPSKHKTLSAIPSTPKKEKKKLRDSSMWV